MRNLKGEKRTSRWLRLFIITSLLSIAMILPASAAAQLDGGTVDLTGWITDAQENYTWGANSYFANSNEAPITNIDYVQPGSSVVIAKDPSFQGKISCYFWAHKFSENEIVGCQFVGTLSSSSFVATGYIDDGIVDNQPATLEFKNFPEKGMDFSLRDCIYQVSIIFEPANEAPYSYAYYFKVKDLPQETVAPSEENTQNQDSNPANANGGQASTDQTNSAEQNQPNTNQTDSAEQTQPNTNQTDSVEQTQPNTNPGTSDKQNQENTNNQNEVNSGEQAPPSTYQPEKTEISDAERMARVYPIHATVLVNGIEKEFEAYEIKFNNYFKLRDLAMAIQDTDKSFNVVWDPQENTISILSQTEYVPNGSEFTSKPDPNVKEAQETTSTVYFDGEEVGLTAYQINNHNYYKLRDVAKLLDIGILWDPAANTIRIYTAGSYEE